MSDGLFQGVNGLFGIMLGREKYRFDISCTTGGLIQDFHQMDRHAPSEVLGGHI